MAARPVGSRPAQRSHVGDLRGPRVGLWRGTLDDQGGDRRGRAGPGSGRGAQRSLQLAGPRRISEQAALRDALLIRGPCRAALGKRAIDTRSGRHWHWQSRGATDTVRLAQPFPPGRADSLLPSNSPRRIWCRLDASVSPYRQDELNRAGRSSTPGGQGAGHYQRDRPA
jgi:hypothetical protein